MTKRYNTLSKREKKRLCKKNSHRGGEGRLLAMAQERGGTDPTREDPNI